MNIDVCYTVNSCPGNRSRIPIAYGSQVCLVTRLNTVGGMFFVYRFASEFGLQPVVVSNSQNDWFSPESFTLEQLRKLIGSKSVRRKSSHCQPGKKAYDTNTCHSIKESDPELVGRRWASLKPTNLTEIGVNTYDEFLTKQVRIFWPMIRYFPSDFLFIADQFYLFDAVTKCTSKHMVIIVICPAD